jgi:protein phosphatase
VSVTFIGDVHGWSDRLERVLTQVAGEAIFLGDLVDRGPDVSGVVRRVRTLVEAGRARCVLGNHEYGLLRAVAYSGFGFTYRPAIWTAWVEGWGGAEALRSYGATDAASLVAAMGSDLDWIAGLPWVLEGPGWIAVHAGLGEDLPTQDQLSMLRRGWSCAEANMSAIFEKSRARVVPRDLPAGTVVVSGHTPQERAVITAQRVLVDTSGGLPWRPLTGVVWPGGAVITS